MQQGLPSRWRSSEQGLRLGWGSSGLTARPSSFAARAQSKQKGDDMALFLVVHELDTHEPEAFVAAWRSGAGSRIRCLRHWVVDKAIALLVEAPNEDGLRAYAAGATEVTELFAPARRWLAYETIDLGR
jgi:hypothetical protein